MKFYPLTNSHRLQNLAHDRATTGYLDRVLEAMRFPQVFRGWARMLHEGATTCLLAGPGGLTRRISVNFSFRQGDPAASPFYALQQEPFLKRVAVVCKGVTIGRWTRPSATTRRSWART